VTGHYTQVQGRLSCDECWLWIQANNVALSSVSHAALVTEILRVFSGSDAYASIDCCCLVRSGLSDFSGTFDLLLWRSFALLFELLSADMELPLQISWLDFGLRHVYVYVS